MFFENLKSFIEESKFRFDKASGHFPTSLSEVEFGVKYDKVRGKNSDLLMMTISNSQFIP